MHKNIYNQNVKIQLISWIFGPECNDDGTIELKQTVLIEHIIETVGFQHAKGKAIPTEVTELPVGIYGTGQQEN